MRRRKTLMATGTESIKETHPKRIGIRVLHLDQRRLSRIRKGGVNTTQSDTSWMMTMEWISMKKWTSKLKELLVAKTTSPREVVVQPSESKQGEDIEEEGQIEREVVAHIIQNELKEVNGDRGSLTIEFQLDKNHPQVQKQQMVNLEEEILEGVQDIVVGDKDLKEATSEISQGDTGGKRSTLTLS
jgi:hypothetical protein